MIFAVLNPERDAIEQHPISFNALRKLFPRISFPREPRSLPDGIVRVEETPKPISQPGERVVEELPEPNGAGGWQQRWNIIAPSQEEIDAVRENAKVQADQLARERMVREMRLPSPIQNDLDATVGAIDAAETIAEIRAALDGVR